VSDFLTKQNVEPVQNLSLVDKVELRLMKLLTKGELQAGDMLPKEVDLAETFGVSRTVVREALTRLRLMGVVESIKHKGSRVKHPDILTNLKRVMQPEILDEDTLKDIFEIRLVLEVGMADLLFDRVTEEDIKELEEIVDDEPEEENEPIFGSDFEARFHGKLYEISGNKTMQQFQSLLLPVFRYVHDEDLLEESGHDVPYASHQELVHTLKEGTPEEFRHVMRRHLNNHFRRIL
jgi:DNA-binding FadR family transcriptional regulator